MTEFILQKSLTGHTNLHYNFLRKFWLHKIMPSIVEFLGRTKKRVGGQGEFGNVQTQADFFQGGFPYSKSANS